MLEYKDLIGKLRFPFDLERIIDDFVFFCFFIGNDLITHKSFTKIGNDFLPSQSTLDIADGSLDKLIELYK